MFAQEIEEAAPGIALGIGSDIDVVGEGFGGEEQYPFAILAVSKSLLEDIEQYCGLIVLAEFLEFMIRVEGRLPNQNFEPVL